MSALDQAFIKAYSKEGFAEQSRAPAPAKARTSATAERPASSQHGPAHGAPAGPLPQIEKIYAAGTLYRIETPQVAEPAAMSAPHYAIEPATRGRLIAHRNRLRHLASENAPPLDRPEPIRPPTARREPVSKTHAPHHAPIAPLLAAPAPAESAPPPVTPQIAPVNFSKSHLPISPSLSHSEERADDAIAAEYALSPPNVLYGTWDNLSQPLPSAIAIWPDDQAWSHTSSGSLLSLDLTAVPAPVATLPTAGVQSSPIKTFRLDAAHEVLPAPHERPATSIASPTPNEPAIAPAPTPELPAPSVIRPPSITAEEAAELAGIPTTTEQPETVTALRPHSAAVIPAWEVDRFLWPEICDKLTSDESSYFAQAGAKLTAAVRDGLKTLAITGSRRGEGRTTLALCIARTAARAGLNVLVIDADFARPQLAASLGLEVAAGWNEAALGTFPLAEAAIKSLEDKITVLPLEVSSAATTLTLADARLTKTIREAAAAFDLAILDLGPTAAGTEPLFPPGEAPPVEAAIVIRDLRYSTLAECHAVGERLQLSGIEAVGLAENFVPSDKMAA